MKPFPNQISSEPLTAELADDGRPAPVQPSIRATAAVCRRPLGRETGPNGQELTTLGSILAEKTSRYQVEPSHNIARCWCSPHAIPDGVWPNGFAWSDIGGESTNQPIVRKVENVTFPIFADFSGVRGARKVSQELENGHPSTATTPKIAT